MRSSPFLFAFSSECKERVIRREIRGQLMLLESLVARTRVNIGLE